MNLRSPWLPLLLLGALALALGVGGVRLARRVEKVRVAREDTALRGFEDALQGELARLEQLYEKHALRVARETPAAEARETREACEWLVGLRQFSLIHALAPGDVAKDFHAPVEARVGETLPEPAFVRGVDGGLPRKRILLPADELLHGAADHGWSAQPGTALIFWQRRDAQHVAVLLLDTTAIRAAMNGWLAEWARAEFAPVRAAGGPDALFAPDDAPLASAGATGSAPNMLRPLRTRFGTWHLASWDRFAVRESWHPPTLLGGLAAALLVALLGVLVFVQPRRAVALAAQRVSFVNRVSHELRTPLTNILLNLDLAAENLAATGEPPRRLALVREEAGRLGRLIDNVLTFSRHEQGKLRADPHACIPASVIAAVVEQFAPSFARRALTVHRTGDATAPCLLDADALAQILANLFSNVEKYVPGGAIEIASTLADGALTVTVADEGPGIAARDAERIFRPFERLGSRVNEGASGTGLGLAIARDLAASMGGSLRLLPSERGAAFELRVPAPPASVISAVA